MANRPLFFYQGYMKLELYYYDQCPFCQIVLKKIKDLNLQEKVELKNTLEKPSNREYHMSTSGKTTVPCLYIEGKPMFESSDINNWLEQNKDSL